MFVRDCSRSLDPDPKNLTKTNKENNRDEQSGVATTPTSLLTRRVSLPIANCALKNEDYLEDS